MSADREKLWVGEFVHSGLMFVYDSALQMQNDSQITIYSMHCDDARSHDRGKLREIVQPVLDPKRKAIAIAQYSKWQQTEGKNYVELELPRREHERELARLERKRETEEKHKTFLKLRAKPFLGTRDRSDHLPLRATHCWACKGSLDSTVNLECVACGWILCTCGACGCGHSRERQTEEFAKRLDDEGPF